ncbi:replication initiator protein [Microviridae sp.]|nr:replication initiator protein [Microviridae sp.]
MPCLNPIEGWLTPNGLSFKPPKGRISGDPIRVACRNCIACKIDRSKEWAVRIMHHAQLHEENMFVTLTYDEDNLPRDQGLHHEHFQLFMKRLRKYAWAHHKKKLSYYMCGEYGEKFGRPHYHAIIFGMKMPDTKKYGKLFNSETLEGLWGLGYTSIGTVTLESAAYVARYIMKKVTGDQAENHYVKAFVDQDTGEIVDTFVVKPEYNRMSTKPAIGKEWFEMYENDFGNDPENQICHINGKQFPMPAYYLKRLKAQNPTKYESVMKARTEHARQNQPTDEELEIRKLHYNHHLRKGKL